MENLPLRWNLVFCRPAGQCWHTGTWTLTFPTALSTAWARHDFTGDFIRALVSLLSLILAPQQGQWGLGTVVQCGRCCLGGASSSPLSPVPGHEAGGRAGISPCPEEGTGVPWSSQTILSPRQGRKAPCSPPQPCWAGPTATKH